MSTDISVVILSGALPLLGVLIGSGSTILVQRSSARESRLRAEA
jgi:Na+/phosphate symporter